MKICLFPLGLAYIEVMSTRGDPMVEELVTLVIMATALGMDAFSIALGMGMLQLRLRQIFHIGIAVGIFHMMMPLLGIFFGKLIFHYFQDVAVFLGGGLLFLIGLQMVYSSLFAKDHGEILVKPVGMGLFLFALSVSIDSFSAGLSLGMLGAKTYLTLIAFGMMSMFLSWSGFLLGSKLKHFIGSYGECLGGLILIGFGIKLFWPH